MNPSYCTAILSYYALFLKLLISNDFKLEPRSLRSGERRGGPGRGCGALPTLVSCDSSMCTLLYLRKPGYRDYTLCKWTHDNCIFVIC